MPEPSYQKAHGAFSLLFFEPLGSQWVSVAQLIPDEQPKESHYYQECVEDTKQKLKGQGKCPQNLNAGAGSLYSTVLSCLPFWYCSHCTKLVGAEVVLQNHKHWIKIWVKFLAPCTGERFASEQLRWSTRKFMDCDGLSLCVSRREIPSSFLNWFLWCMVSLKLFGRTYGLCVLVKHGRSGDAPCKEVASGASCSWSSLPSSDQRVTLAVLSLKKSSKWVYL